MIILVFLGGVMNRYTGVGSLCDTCFSVASASLRSRPAFDCTRVSRDRKRPVLLIDCVQRRVALRNAARFTSVFRRHLVAKPSRGNIAKVFGFAFSNVAA